MFHRWDSAVDIILERNARYPLVLLVENVRPHLSVVILVKNADLQEINGNGQLTDHCRMALKASSINSEPRTMLSSVSDLEVTV